MDRDALKVAAIALVAAAIGFYLGTRYAPPGTWTLTSDGGTLFNSSTGEVYRVELEAGKYFFLRRPLRQFDQNY